MPTINVENPVKYDGHQNEGKAVMGVNDTTGSDEWLYDNGGEEYINEGNSPDDIAIKR